VHHLCCHQAQHLQWFQGFTYNAMPPTSMGIAQPIFSWNTPPNFYRVTSSSKDIIPPTICSITPTLQSHSFHQGHPYLPLSAVSHVPIFPTPFFSPSSRVPLKPPCLVFTDSVVTLFESPPTLPVVIYIFLQLFLICFAIPAFMTLIHSLWSCCYHPTVSQVPHNIHLSSPLLCELEQ